MRLSILVPALSSFSGVVLLSVASVLYRRKKSRYESWITANGRLTGYKEDQGKYGRMYAPVVVFDDYGGHEVKFTSRISSGKRRFEVGDHVPVRYNPKDSNKALIDLTFELYFLEIVVGLAGGWCLIAGPLVFFLLKLR